MASKIHLYGKSFDLQEGADPTALTEDILKAMDLKKPLSIGVVYHGNPLTIILNGERLDFVTMDLNGAIIGFHSG
ncbi:hypothetical protein GCM10009850_042560 [Nonomuraea monospora]|uniref:Uncharacterized protein n=1 Tax=Nonomuraea monospora TaxID=568818 RepID=A0ABN3CHD3_9ACTN